MKLLCAPYSRLYSEFIAPVLPYEISNENGSRLHIHSRDWIFGCVQKREKNGEFLFVLNRFWPWEVTMDFAFTRPNDSLIWNQRNVSQTLVEPPDSVLQVKLIQISQYSDWKFYSTSIQNSKALRSKFGLQNACTCGRQKIQIIWKKTNKICSISKAIKCNWAFISHCNILKRLVKCSMFQNWFFFVFIKIAELFRSNSVQTVQLCYRNCFQRNWVRIQ